MTEPNPAGVSIPLRPAETGGEGAGSLSPPPSPSQRRAGALLIETSSGYRHDEA